MIAIAVLLVFTLPLAYSAVVVPLSAEEQAKFEERARSSLAQQAELEQNEVGDFDVFVGAYQASILAISN